MEMFKAEHLYGELFQGKVATMDEWRGRWVIYFTRTSLHVLEIGDHKKVYCERNTG